MLGPPRIHQVAAARRGRAVATPATRAAVSGASGSASRTPSCRDTSPASRRTSARSPSSSGPIPVCAGLTTATRRPSESCTAASAAVTTVLPTSVSVPVTTTTVTAGPSSTPTARASSSSSSCAWAVSRSREMPSGVEGGRKQPMRTPFAGGLLDRGHRLERAGHRDRQHRAGRRLDAAGVGQHGGDLVDPRDPMRLVLDDPQRGERTAGRRGSEAGVVDERAGAVDEVLADGRGGQHGASLGAQRLAQGQGGRRRRGARPARRRAAARARRAPATPRACASSATSTASAGGAHLGRARPPGRRHPAPSRSSRPAPAPARCVRAASAASTAATSLWGTTCDAGAAEPAGVDHRGVHVGVGDDEGVGVGQRGHGREVGVVAGREHQRRRETGERGERLLELLVDGQRAGDQAGGAGPGAVLLRPRRRHPRRPRGWRARPR